VLCDAMDIDESNRRRSASERRPDSSGAAGTAARSGSVSTTHCRRFTASRSRSYKGRRRAARLRGLDRHDVRDRSGALPNVSPGQSHSLDAENGYTFDKPALHERILLEAAPRKSRARLEPTPLPLMHQ
jgi:hypothetical protein